MVVAVRGCGDAGAWGGAHARGRMEDSRSEPDEGLGCGVWGRCAVFSGA